MPVDISQVPHKSNIKYLQQQWRVNDCSHMLPIIHSAYHLFFFFPFFLKSFLVEHHY